MCIRDSVKAKSAAEQATPATCVYETTWMPLPPATESTRHEGAHLLLSREAVAGVLPKGWRLSVAKEEAQLLAEASSQRWTTVVLWGSNTEEDVELGLRLMQTAQAERLVFVTGAQNEGDAGLWGLARTFRLERPDLRVRCIESVAGAVEKVLALATSTEAEDELSVDEAGTCLLYTSRCV